MLELEEPSGWVVIPLTADDAPHEPLKAFYLQLAVLANHQNGRDTHIRQVRVPSPAYFLATCFLPCMFPSLHSALLVLSGHTVFDGYVALAWWPALWRAGAVCSPQWSRENSCCMGFGLRGGGGRQRVVWQCAQQLQLCTLPLWAELDVAADTAAAKAQAAWPQVTDAVTSVPVLPPLCRCLAAGEGVLSPHGRAAATAMQHDHPADVYVLHGSVRPAARGS